MPQSGASLIAQSVKYLPAMQETWVWSLGQEDPLEKDMATYFRIPAWRIPWAEEPGRLQSMGSKTVGQPLKWLTLSDWLGKASQKSSAVFSLRTIKIFWLVLNRGWYLSHQGTIRSYNQVKISRENMSGHCPYPYYVRGYHLLNAYHGSSAYT